MTPDSLTVPLHRAPEIRAAAAQALTQLRERCSASTAMVLTDDGFEVARHPETSDDHQRLASMSSSLQALGEAIMRELGLGSARYALLEAAGGHALLMRVPDQRMVVAAVFADFHTVGKAITVTRAVTAEFAEAIAADIHPVAPREDLL